MKKSNLKEDYLILVSESQTTPGANSFDVARAMPGKSLTRTFESIEDETQKDFPKYSDHILARGAICGLDESGNVTHFAPGQRFVGILEGQTEKRANVRVRGSVVVRVKGATSEDDRGKCVYCSDFISFTLQKESGAAEVGRIRFFQEGRAAVAFKRIEDEKPLNLKVRRF